MKIRLVLTSLLFLWSALWSDSPYLHRQSSYPYLSGDTFRFFADWRLSTQEHFSPDEVQLGDIIFVEHNYLTLFEKEYLPKIASPIVLLTAYCEFDSDIPLPGRYKTLAESEKVGCWFVIHLDRPATEKIQPIPIGICNSIHPHGNLELFARYVAQSESIKKTIHTFVNFRVDSNPAERKPCWNYFAKQPFARSWFVAVEGKTRSQAKFWNEMSRSRFVVSPPGAGVDAFRTWEALLMGAYPIVKSSFLNPLYEDLPVVIIRDWREVTRSFLDKKFQEFQHKTFNWEKLYAPFWFEKIGAAQDKIRAS